MKHIKDEFEKLRLGFDNFDRGMPVSNTIADIWESALGFDSENLCSLRELESVVNVPELQFIKILIENNAPVPTLKLAIQSVIDIGDIDISLIRKEIIIAFLHDEVNEYKALLFNYKMLLCEGNI